NDKYIKKTPWDQRAIALDTFEILEYSENVLQNLTNHGHYTIKINPLESKDILHKYGFYYCDTLIEPYCKKADFIKYEKSEISINNQWELSELINICHGAFNYDRFHRDFNIDGKLADLRYDFWLQDIYQQGNVFALMYNQEIAGFFAYDKNKILLHALKSDYRGKGLAKYFWTVACEELFNMGYNEISSSISAANMAILNLYSSLGFKFRNPVDIYHKIISS
ncbi:MAG TPA: GNAT family N-acetyltransferase, partial [Allocoleopsis sp.]